MSLLIVLIFFSLMEIHFALKVARKESCFVLFCFVSLLKQYSLFSYKLDYMLRSTNYFRSAWDQVSSVHKVLLTKTEIRFIIIDIL